MLKTKILLVDDDPNIRQLVNLYLAKEGFEVAMADRGDTALVGVKFDNVYKGRLTERIRQMVAAEVLRADPSIQTVAVTSDEGDVARVYQLSDQIRAGRTASELSQEINAIVRNATTLR